MIPALLKWIGNKQRFAEIIISYMPHNFNRYFEPFLGSGAVLGELLNYDLNKLFPRFNRAYASDVLPFLVDIFNLVKNDPQSLVQYYKNEITAYYEDPNSVYDATLQRFNKIPNAYDFCVLSRTCYSGVIRFRKTDGHMSTPRGPHNPIKPQTFEQRVLLWSSLVQKADFSVSNFFDAMDIPNEGDVVYCDPPYTHSQSIIYGAQGFSIDKLWIKIEECKARGAFVMLSINGMRESTSKDISVVYPQGLFEREIVIDCGISMINRLQSSGKEMTNENVHDKLLLTW
ncbi:MAG: Dam family site-specific DNA-(adenine-N6)-methyltransferase [Defluviitaleaceae bacterium]|nr:Dam family site-specific DNA-(adenine-N6)-methyltransferase [Defluviitaleaceae bacterium]